MRSQHRLIALCCAALFVPLFVPLCTGRVFTRDDLAAWHLPFRFLYSEALHTGDSFLWTRAILSGFYIHGEGEAGLAHPLHLLLYRTLPLGPAFNLEIIASYVALLSGTAMLLRRLDVSREAAWFGAMAFAFSGFNLFNLMHVNHIAAVAHAPWVLLAGYVIMASPRPRERAWAFGSLALLVGSQILVGNPQYVWMTYVALGYMTLCVLWAGAGFARVPLLIGALMLGALVGSVQLLPTLDFAQGSTRATWSLFQALSFSLAPLNLVQLWSPFVLQFRVYAPPDEASLPHEFIVYNGAFCTLALAWVAMRWREQTRRGLLTALLVFAGIALVLAMGRHAGIYAWLAQLPGLRNFRAPARHLVLFHMALSGIAAIAFEDLVALVRRGEQIVTRRLWPLAVPIALSVLTTVLAAALTTSASSLSVPLSAPMRAAPWSALVILMSLLLASAARGVRWAVPVVIVFAACDLGLWGYSYAFRWGPLQTIDELAASATVPPDARRGDLVSPMKIGGPPVNLAFLRGLRLTAGYSGLEPASVLDLHDPLTERIAGVTWRGIGTTWVPASDSMPRARLVTVAMPSRAINADVHAVDISRIALVDEPVGALSGEPGSVRLVSDRPGSIIVETAATGRQLLVVTERFHAGWRASEDGRARATLRVYGDFLGCVVEPGDHHVTLTFDPDSTRQGVRASAAGLALTFVATAWLWRRKDRAPHARGVAGAR